MVNHYELQSAGFAGKRQLSLLIRNKLLTLAGNRRLKIYGSLSCASGKRMKIVNRVFFINEQEAIEKGYRPCGHCLRNQYLLWREINNNKIALQSLALWP